MAYLGVGIVVGLIVGLALEWGIDWSALRSHKRVEEKTSYESDSE